VGYTGVEGNGKDEETCSPSSMRRASTAIASKRDLKPEHVVKEGFESAESGNEAKERWKNCKFIR